MAKYKSTIIIVGIVLIGYYIYKMGKKAGGFISYPTSGAGIPTNWNPRSITIQLQNAFCPSSGFPLFCAGTNEELIWSALTNLTQDQLASVYNDYLHYTGTNLLDEFNDELYGEELTKALSYFSFISGKFTFEKLFYNLTT